MKYPTFILALLFGLTCHPGTIDGRVVSVADGDTVTVLYAEMVQHKIRLSGIDAPQRDKPMATVQKKASATWRSPRQ